MPDLEQTRLDAADELEEAIVSVSIHDPLPDRQTRLQAAVDAITQHVAAAIAARHPNPEGPRTDANIQRTP